MELTLELEQLGTIHYGIITVFCRPVQGTFSEEIFPEVLFLLGKVSRDGDLWQTDETGGSKEMHLGQPLLRRFR